MKNYINSKSNISVSRKIYEEVLDRVKSITKDVVSSEDVSKWLFGGIQDLDMCFVGDDCPKLYRKDIMYIIKDVESHYSK